MTRPRRAGREPAGLGGFEVESQRGIAVFWPRPLKYKQEYEHRRFRKVPCSRRLVRPAGSAMLKLQHTDPGISERRELQRLMESNALQVELAGLASGSALPTAA